MDFMKWIEENSALFAMLIVWAAVIMCAFMHVPFGQAGRTPVVSYILTVIVISVILAIIPATIVLFGWLSKNKSSAVILGTLLIPTLYLLGFIAFSHGNMVFLRVPETVLFLAGLSVISGLAGYCAAHRTQRFLIVAIILTGLWVVVMTSGFD